MFNLNNSFLFIFFVKFAVDTTQKNFSFQKKGLVMKVINIFGAPSSGKTTLAHGLMHHFKTLWADVEFSPEYAKDLVLLKSSHMLSFQNHVFGEQDLRLSRLKNQSEIAITDAPLLNSAFWAPKEYSSSFRKSVFDFFGQYDNINLLLVSNVKYNPTARVQNEHESNLISNALPKFLLENGVPFYEVLGGDFISPYLVLWFIEKGLIEKKEKFNLKKLEQIKNQKNFEETPSYEQWEKPTLTFPVKIDGTPRYRYGQSAEKDYFPKGARRF